MGLTTVKLTIKNALKPSRAVEENFMVDSGAHYTLLPQEIVRKLGIVASYQQEFVLADGKVIRRPMGAALINFEGRELPVPVVLGQKEDSALLGVTTLESFGLMLDPFKRKIYPSKLMLG